ncbi:hypothetical protein BOTCAL_0494g00080 [Botryotinia calthae]|uniref:Uncharacterized protein n=1 Tax=Botryotinia calthae TaxID=38488 RepID=A0A4Y8CLN0_9HELO|nr:hypothetical protein BOTCAL_0494g00080 [Botryotinia calthae]
MSNKIGLSKLNFSRSTTYTKGNKPLLLASIPYRTSTTQSRDDDLVKTFPPSDQTSSVQNPGKESVESNIFHQNTSTPVLGSNRVQSSVDKAISHNPTKPCTLPSQANQGLRLTGRITPSTLTCVRIRRKQSREEHKWGKNATSNKLRTNFASNKPISLGDGVPSTHIGSKVKGLASTQTGFNSTFYNGETRQHVSYIDFNQHGSDVILFPAFSSLLPSTDVTNHGLKPGPAFGRVAASSTSKIIVEESLFASISQLPCVSEAGPSAKAKAVQKLANFSSLIFHKRHSELG